MRPIRTLPGAFLATLMASTLLVGSAAAEDQWIAAKGSGCQVWTDKAPAANEEATWSGQCVDGKASGEGKLEWHRGGKLVGTYEGYMKAGRLNGPGNLKLATASGKFESVEGLFKDGKVDGGAIYEEADGDIYMGELKDGKPHDVGYAKRGSEEYTGDFVDGKRQGIGLLITDKESYLGEFENDKANGSGILQDSQGGRLHGQFKNGAPNGAGTYVTAEGAIYQGEFKNGKAEGRFLVKRSKDAKPVVQTWKNGKRVKR